MSRRSHYRRQGMTNQQRLDARASGKTILCRGLWFFATGKRGSRIDSGHPSAEYETLDPGAPHERIWMDLKTGECVRE